MSKNRKAMFAARPRTTSNIIPFPQPSAEVYIDNILTWPDFERFHLKRDEEDPHLWHAEAWHKFAGRWVEAYNVSRGVACACVWNGRHRP